MCVRVHVLLLASLFPRKRDRDARKSKQALAEIGHLHLRTLICWLTCCIVSSSQGPGDHNPSPPIELPCDAIVIPPPFLLAKRRVPSQNAAGVSFRRFCAFSLEASLPEIRKGVQASKKTTQPPPLARSSCLLFVFVGELARLRCSRLFAHSLFHSLTLAAQFDFAPAALLDV